MAPPDPPKATRCSAVLALEEGPHDSQGTIHNLLYFTDLELIHNCYLNIQIIWFDLLKRHMWQGAWNPSEVNISWQKVTMMVSQIVASWGSS